MITLLILLCCILTMLGCLGCLAMMVKLFTEWMKESKYRQPPAGSQRGSARTTPPIELPGVPMLDALRSAQEHIAEDHKTLRTLWLLHQENPPGLCQGCLQPSPCRSARILEGFATDLQVSVEDNKGGT